MSSSSSSGSSPRTNEPKLTRQKNLRYLSEREIDNAVNLPDAAAESPSPQPLPLPQLAVFFRKKQNTFSNSEVTDCPLPSPKENHDYDNDAATRLCSRRRSDAWKGASSLQNKFQINVPTRSVPTSSCGSLLVSPPGKPTGGDFYPYYYLTPKANDIWSAPEMPTTNPPVYDSDPQRNSCDQIKSPHRRTDIFEPCYGDRFGRPDETHILNTPSYPLPTQVHRLPLPPEPSPSPVQRNGTWKKGKLLGRGTFGSVYVATNRETGALCAMKEVELCPDDPKSIECMKQIQQEIKVLSHLKHPNIVQYYGSEIVDDRFYIYLEYVHPGSINKYVREHCGAMTESVVRNFTRHILSGLAYLHNKKTIHRDIKGANLLVDASGVVKLADFGMAKHLSGQATDLSLKGSPYWMAPELMEAVIDKDHKSDLALAIDIWSLGCTIIEMLTGKPPWSEYEGVAAMFKVMKDTPPIPPTLSSEGKDFLRCCFQRNPADRPSASVLLHHSFLKG